MPAKGTSYQPGPDKRSTRTFNTKKCRRHNDSAPHDRSDEVDDTPKRQHVETFSDHLPRLLGTGAPEPTSSIAASTLKPQMSASPKVPRSPPITTSTYRATLQTLEKILRQKSMSCKHGAAHEQKERKTVWCCCKAEADQQEAEVCDDPDCKTIWYHKTCLDQELKDFCGRFNLWTCKSCFFKRKHQHDSRRREVTAEGQGTPSGTSPEAASNDSTRGRDPLALPKSADSITARQTLEEKQCHKLPPLDTLSSLPPARVKCFSTEPGDQHTAPAPPEEPQTCTRQRITDAQSQLGGESTRTSEKTSSAARKEVNGHEERAGTATASSTVDTADSTEQDQDSHAQQFHSPRQNRGAIADIVTSPNTSTSNGSPESRDAQKPKCPIRVRVEQRYANFRFENPECGKAYRVTEAAAIEASAKSWTSDKSSCSGSPTPQGREILIQYKHNEELPPTAEEHGASEAVLYIKCCYDDDFRSKPAVEVPVRILTSLSPSLYEYDVLGNQSKLAKAAPHSVVGTIDVGRIDCGVVEKVVRLLKGGSSETADLAHKLDLPCLQQAALHAIYVSILRDSTDWDNEETRWLLQAATLEGNPARDLDRILESIVLDNPHALQLIPCEEDNRSELCAMSVVSFGEGDIIQLDPKWNA